MRLRGKVAIVTGAAAGIGRAVAMHFGGEGAYLALLDIDGYLLTDSVKFASQSGCDVMAIPADVTDPEAIDRAFAAILERWGRVDILVNNVGGSTVISRPHRVVEELTVSEWHSTMAFNLNGTFLCCRAAIPHMKSRHYGRIVNVSSIAARGNIRSTNAAYAAAKAGIVAFTRKLALELGPFGITCNATAPTLTLTDRIRRLRSESTNCGLRIEDIPLGRAATPEEQASVIAFLASDDAAFISGQTIEVTGGM